MNNKYVYILLCNIQSIPEGSNLCKETTSDHLRSVMWKSHHRPTSDVLWKLPELSGDRHRKNKLRPICVPQDKTGPTSFVCHLFITPVSIVLWGQSPFKWQMGGTFEHVMWSFSSLWRLQERLHDGLCGSTDEAFGEKLSPELWEKRWRGFHWYNIN